MSWKLWGLAAATLVCLALLPWTVQANETIIELPQQAVKSLSGVVTAHGDPVPGAQVVEYRSDWKNEIRRTTTDAQGRFSLKPIKGQKIYYLQVSAPGPGINPLRVPVKISHHGRQTLDLRLELA